MLSRATPISPSKWMSYFIGKAEHNSTICAVFGPQLWCKILLQCTSLKSAIHFYVISICTAESSNQPFFSQLCPLNMLLIQWLFHLSAGPFFLFPWGGGAGGLNIELLEEFLGQISEWNQSWSMLPLCWCCWWYKIFVWVYWTTINKSYPRHPVLRGELSRGGQQAQVVGLQDQLFSAKMNFWALIVHLRT